MYPLVEITKAEKISERKYLINDIEINVIHM